MFAYLTIDDGPTPDMDAYVDYLESMGMKAIWFCLGENLARYSEQTTYAIRKGHVIANHSYNHPLFSDLDLEAARKQIAETEYLIDAIYDQAGAMRPARLFRFPSLNNGSTDPYTQCDWDNSHVQALQMLLEELGFERLNCPGITYDWYKSAGFMDCINVDCTYDSHDWCLKDGVEMHGCRDLETVLARAEEDVPQGGRGLNRRGSDEIVMMHADTELAAFREIMGRIAQKGLKFTLPEFGDIRFKGRRIT